jgi:hypothetical protein
VNAAAAYLSALGGDNPKVILLVTDGAPNCAPGSADPLADDTAGAVAAIEAAAALGFPTVVVGVATAGRTEDAALTALANAGGLPRAGAPAYYTPTSDGELANLLATAVTAPTACTFSLVAAPNSMTSVDFIDLFADGIQIPHDPTHVNGWDYINAAHTAVQIFGATCARITAGSVIDVTVIYRCPVG